MTAKTAKPTTKTKTGPGLARMKKRLGPKGTEALRGAVVADQAKAQTEVAKTKPTKTETAPTKKADDRTITVLAKTNPHAKGSKRAAWFGLLKNKMTVEEAVKAGVRNVYLQRMHARGVIKLG
jgi:hypothetical protein